MLVAITREQDVFSLFGSNNIHDWNLRRPETRLCFACRHFGTSGSSGYLRCHYDETYNDVTRNKVKSSFWRHNGSFFWVLQGPLTSPAAVKLASAWHPKWKCLALLLLSASQVILLSALMFLVAIFLWNNLVFQILGITILRDFLLWQILGI